MEPVTLVVTALAAAAPIVGKKVCEEVVADAYRKLKELLHHRCGTESEVTQALAKVEAAPESQARQAVLAEEIGRAGIAHEPEIIAAARELLQRLEQQSVGVQHVQSITGNFNAQADHGATATVTVNQTPRL